MLHHFIKGTHINKLLILTLSITLSLQAVITENNEKQLQQDPKITLAAAALAQQNQGLEELPLSKRLAQTRDLYEKGVLPKFARKNDKWVIHFILKSLLEGKDNLVDIPLDKNELGGLIQDTFRVQLGQKERLTIVEKLVRRGADVNIKVGCFSGFEYKSSLKPHQYSMYSEQDTPFHSAIDNGYLPIVKLLMNHDAKVNPPNPTNNTPLRYAVWSGHLATVKLLLENGANPNHPQEPVFRFTSPLDQTKNKEIKKLLKKYGAAKSESACPIM